MSDFTLVLPSGESLEQFQTRVGEEPGSMNDALLAGLEHPDGEIEMVLIPPGASLQDIRNAIDVTARPPSDPDLNRVPKTKV